jgi:hypothetical protein
MSGAAIYALPTAAAAGLFVICSARVRAARRFRRLASRRPKGAVGWQAPKTVRVLRDPGEISLALETAAARSHLYITAGGSRGPSAKTRP